MSTESTESTTLPPDGFDAVRDLYSTGVAPSDDYDDAWGDALTRPSNRPYPTRPFKECPEPDLSETAQKVLAERYLQPGETPADLFWRVAWSVAGVDPSSPSSSLTVDLSSSSTVNREPITVNREPGTVNREPGTVNREPGTVNLAAQFYSLMASLRFLPNSPTLMNAGTELGQLSACFVLPVPDSMEGIFEAIKQAALIHKSGGGTGFSFSRLRGKDAPVKSTNGVASGPLSFMQVFDAATNTVKQGSKRRGANMGILRVDHPDIEDFVKAKHQDHVLPNFNLSVGLTEDFMQAYHEDRPYPLIDPATNETTGQLRARRIMDLIVEHAWKNGEPGVIFLDTVNAHNPTPWLGDIEATNPCVSGETWVLTPGGPRQVKDILGEPVCLRLGDMLVVSPAGFFCSGTKDVYRLHTTRGYSIDVTAEHLIWSEENGWVEAQDLVQGEGIVMGSSQASAFWPGDYTWEHGYLLGLMVGNGRLTNSIGWLALLESEGRGRGIEGPKRIACECAKVFSSRRDPTGWREHTPGWYTMKLKSLADLAFDLGMTPKNKMLTPRLERCSSDFCHGFLAGCFDTNGFVVDDQTKGVSVRLSQSDLPGLQVMQRMLQRFGILSTIHTNRHPGKSKLMPAGHGGPGKYQTKANHELCITQSNLQRFAVQIGFRDEKQKLKLDSLLDVYRRIPDQDRNIAPFDGLEYMGSQPVYDIRIPGANAFEANGLIVHNCGEQPLLPYESCNLGSINLSKYVVQHPASSIDWDTLEQDIHLAVRFLDNIIDQNNYPLPEVREATLKTRKIGLGVMGWADALIKMGIPYHADEAVKLAEKVMGFINEQSRDASCALAEQRGPYPASRHPETGIQKSASRNAALTCIAPTGTLSMIADCSPGIEPLYALAQTKTCLDGTKFTQVHPELEGALIAIPAGPPRQGFLDSVSRTGVIPHAQWFGGHPCSRSDFESFVTAHEIAPEAHLRMQAAFQEHCDAAVSKTINLPADASKDDVRRVFEEAHALGCKGVTLYRDGSRDGQVLTAGTGEGRRTSDVGDRQEPASGSPSSRPPTLATSKPAGEDGSDVRPPTSSGTGAPAPAPRPSSLPGHTHKLPTGMGALYVTVNELEGRPFEVFTTIGRSGRSVTAKTEAIGRLVSLCLRSNISLQAVVKQLDGIIGETPQFHDGGLVKSVPDAIARILKQYLPSADSGIPAFQDSSIQEASFSEPHTPCSMPSALAPCPDCGNELQHQEGCLLCPACGYAKCG